MLKAIGNVLLKVVTAPFSFLSGNRDNLEYINIDPQQYAFTSEQYASLDKIAQALRDQARNAYRPDAAHQHAARPAPAGG
ncbi:MAG: hypothetical protein ACLSGF_09875 [Alistipes onderdonkii]